MHNFPQIYKTYQYFIEVKLIRLNLYQMLCKNNYFL